ncbi:AcrR family transcriptional regulator [Amycolatopsis endophytica]|uniref:AcrR family transcriptional regulator n=1 Tax=Amycolatopsis endophytica TaxID=860233 RepID=A0A853B8C6_9PSEU|nr:AcrR family transcriptional regulator [Amycolatopsis endophytica]
MRAELAGIALGLFAEHGFDGTTVDDIARAAGMTKRSFFRYFPVKEDAVFAGVDALGEDVVGDLRERPPGEDPWESLRTVLGRWQERIHGSERELAGLRLIESTPVLRARLHQKREEWRASVAAVLRERAELDEFGADLVVNAAVAALDTAAAEWLRSGERGNRGALLDRAFEVCGRADPRRAREKPQPSSCLIAVAVADRAPTHVGSRSWSKRAEGRASDNAAAGSAPDGHGTANPTAVRPVSVAWSLTAKPRRRTRPSSRRNRVRFTAEPA